MHHLFEYDLYIFDCDGVILDSNALKIQAMERALTGYSESEISSSLDYFAKNFGKSRYHHVEFFLRNVIKVSESDFSDRYSQVLNLYARACEKLYLSAAICDGFIEFISSLRVPCYVASGSDQDELRQVFAKRKLSKYFIDILGSPEKKANNVRKILSESKGKALMIGDSLSDLEAARECEIDFLFVSKYSASPETVRSTSLFSENEEILSFSSLAVYWGDYK
jgi:phosphoglycolate phosphatase-like HAD superfamily hydrolase